MSEQQMTPAEIERAVKETCAKDAQDAARYRWLRRQDQNTTIKMTHYGFDALDSIIDAARAASPEVKDADHD